MTRKKILHVAEPFATGVLCFLVDLTKKQIEQYDITIVWGVRPLTPPNVESLFDKRIKLIRLDSFKGAIGTVINPKCYIDLRRIYNEEKPDIVHLHSSASGFVGRWALPCGKVPTFYTPHGFSFLAGNGGGLKRFIFHAIEWLSAKRPATIVACSPGEYKEARKLTPKSTFVNNGVKLPAVYIEPTKPTNHKVRICTIGRILTQKNPALFNEIAKLLPDVDFTWIGEGELQTQLTARNITVTGWLERSSAQRLTMQSDIFLLTSLWEGLPLSLLEAMAMGKVCIVSDVIGNRDVIENGVNGYICHTAQEFADSIRRAVNEPHEAMRKAARQDVEENYNSDLMAEKYSRIYNAAFSDKQQ